MTIDQLLEIVGDKGFVHVHSAATAVVIPTGFLIIIASTGCKGLRWSLCADDADQQRARVQLNELLVCYPGLAAPNLGMTGCLEYLKADDS